MSAVAGMVAMARCIDCDGCGTCRYLDPTVMDNTTFHDIITILENEFDWPMLSASTGFDNASMFHPDITGPVNSTYQVRARGRVT